MSCVYSADRAKHEFEAFQPSAIRKDAGIEEPKADAALT